MMDRRANFCTLRILFLLISVEQVRKLLIIKPLVRIELTLPRAYHLRYFVICFIDIDEYE